MSDLVVAWDIETCPTEFNAFGEAQQSRYEWELKVRTGRRPDEPRSESSRLVRSIHPFLGWICCISAVSGTLDDGPNTPRSWTAATPDAESILLSRFWQAIGRFPQNVRWVTFNGKRFDVPFLTARSTRNRIAPLRKDILDTYPYNHRPHSDLSLLWPQYYSLEDLCEHVGMNSPKSEMDGSRVATAVEEGRIEDVARYGKRDVVATFRCLQAVRELL